jgi:hypothetical protein
MPDDKRQPLRSRNLLWIESQANAIAPHLLMPAEPFKTEADSVYGRLSKEPGFDPLDSMPEIIRELAEFFGVTAYSASKRLAEVGYQMAAGAMDWIGEEYVKPYGYQAGALKAGETFSLSFEKCLESVSNNDELRVAVDLGRLRFCDGHLCVNDPKYLERSSDGRTRLTDYGRRHVDECCVKFAREGYFGVFAGGGVSFGLNTGASFCRTSWQVSFIVKTLPTQSSVIEAKNPTKEACESYYKEVDAAKKAIADMDYHRALEYLRHDYCNITLDDLADLAGVDERTIRRYENSGECVRSPEKRTLAAICWGMHLEEDLSGLVMSKAGCSLSDQNSEDVAIKRILNSRLLSSIEDVNAFMEDEGLGPLVGVKKRKE